MVVFDFLSVKCIGSHYHISERVADTCLSQAAQANFVFEMIMTVCKTLQEKYLFFDKNQKTVLQMTEKKLPYIECVFFCLLLVHL